MTGLIGKEINQHRITRPLGEGGMLFELTADRLLFDIKLPTNAALKHLKEPIPLPRSFHSGLPEFVYTR
jgi:hypothetical protein